MYNTNETRALLCDSGSVRIENCTERDLLGFVAWSTSPFELTTLLEPLTNDNNETAFPVYDLQTVEKYAMNGTNLNVSEVFVNHPQTK